MAGFLSWRGQAPEASFEGGSHHPALDRLWRTPVPHQGHWGLILSAGEEAPQLCHLQGAREDCQHDIQAKWTYSVCDRNFWLLKQDIQTMKPVGPKLSGYQFLWNRSLLFVKTLFFSSFYIGSPCPLVQVFLLNYDAIILIWQVSMRHILYVGGDENISTNNELNWPLLYKFTESLSLFFF